MKYIGNVQSQANAEVFAVASGALPDGKPVIVNSDGTVSVVTETSVSEAIGSAQQFLADTLRHSQVAFDANSNRIVIAFRDANAKGAYIVGTVNSANKTISFGTVAIFNNVSNTTVSGICFDSTNNKIIITWQNGNETNRGYVIVGNVDPSDNSMSFGSSVAYESGQTNDANPVFDTNAGKVVIVFVDEGDSRRGKAIVGTVSGTSISFGSAATFHTDVQGLTVAVYDPTSQKVIIPYKDGNDADKGKCKVATVSGTSISFGNIATFESSNVSNDIAVAYDVNSSKVVVVYSDAGNSDFGKAVVGTVSGTTISFGSSATFESAATSDIDISYDIANKVNVISYDDGGNSNYGTYIVGTVSGTSISFGTPVVFISNTYANPSSCYDSTAEKIILTSHNSSQGGIAFVLQNATTSTNLTTENFLGFTGGEVTPQVLTSAVFEAASINEGNAVYDSNSDKVVIVYRDGGNSEKGTAIVGTVSGSSITFGTAVVFQAQTLSELSCAFDSNSNKVVIAYKHDSDSGKGKAIVGTVSGTDISFGSAAEFEGGALKSGTSTTFDSSNNKIIIAYLDDDDGDKGKVVVATVSGTSISFGTPVVFNDATTREPNVTFDSNSNKVVVAFQDHGNSSQGTAVVGTVSGTGISFGSETIFNAASTEYPRLTFDSSNNKVLVFFKDSADSNKGKVIVGTVSGTGISFGTEVDTGAEIGSNDLRIAFNTSTNKAVIAYRNTGNSSYGTLQIGTVSGTSISLESAIVFNSASSNVYSVVFDPDTNQTVIVYRNGGNSNHGTTSIFVPELRPEIADGKLATIQVGGSINTEQLSLTAGQQYFVQTDGTIGTTAASPSVIAGTAVSATDLIVKG